MQGAGKPQSKLRRLAARLWREHTTPHRLALAVAVGIVVGCSPFYGLHFWIGLGLAALLRLNKVAVFLGAQISIPPLAPSIGFASVQTGSLILSRHVMHLTPSDFTLSSLPRLLSQFLLDWLVGGLVVGSILATVGFVVTRLVLRARRPGGASGADPMARDLRRAITRYACAPRPHRHYARFKYRMDPLYRQVCDLLGHRDRVIDLGTGLGMLPVLLAIRGQVDHVLGVDWDRAKIESGRLASAGLTQVELLEHDIRTCPLEPEQADVVVLADVLHYFPPSEQDSILRRAAGALRPAGRLVVRDTDGQGRSRITRWMEALAMRVGWNRGPGLSYRTAEELRQSLRSLGLLCGAGESSSSVVHRGNVMVWGDRPTER